jgi:hypothetical protein
LYIVNEYFDNIEANNKNNEQKETPRKKSLFGFLKPKEESKVITPDRTEADKLRTKIVKVLEAESDNLSTTGKDDSADIIASIKGLSPEEIRDKVNDYVKKLIEKSDSIHDNYDDEQENRRNINSSDYSYIDLTFEDLNNYVDGNSEKLNIRGNHK